MDIKIITSKIVQKRPLHSYCQRFYALQERSKDFAGWDDIEYFNAECSEEEMKEYVEKKYGINNHRIIQVIVTEIYYEI